MNMLKKLVRRGLGYIYTVEYLLDLIMYIKYRIIRKNRISKFYKAYKVDYSKDLVVAFYCGIGDFIYGVSLFYELKQKLNAHSGCKLIAYVGGSKNKMNNPLISTLIEDLGVFDEVKVFNPPVPGYWKTLRLEEIYSNEDTDNVFAFTYKTANSVSNRISSIYNQFSLDGSQASLGIPIKKRDKGNDVSKLIMRVEATKRKVVLLHLDARSGNYNYEDIVSLSLSLIKLGYTVLTYTPKIECMDNNVIDFENLLSSPYFFIAPGQLSIYSTLYVLERLTPFVVAVNSIFWPLTQVTRTKTLALHYIDSGDGHQFFHDDMVFVTTNKFSYKKIKGLPLSENSVIYAYPDDYDIDSRNYRNYHSDYIVHLVCLYANL